LAFGFETKWSACRPFGHDLLAFGKRRIGSGKYLNRDLEVPNMRCYYADVGDYRCASLRGVAIFAGNLTPEKLRKQIEDECDTVDKMLRSSKCSFALRINYDADDVTKDVMSGYQKRPVIKLDEVELVAAPSKSKRKRR
jgi:hypothetical protein